MQSHPRRRLSPLGLALVLAALGAGAAAAQPVIVEREMPAPIVERAPPPRPGLNWVPGHWVWRGGEWFWSGGHYVEVAVPPMPAVVVETQPPRPSPEHFWVRGHWGWDEHRWTWRPGVWFRP
jgi:WXXGXW repeat (2 copies)